MTRAPAQGFSAAGFGSPSSASPASAAPAGALFGVAAAAPASASPFGRPPASPAATSSGPSTAAAAACAGSHEKIGVTQDALRCVDATISTVAVSCAPRLAADFSCSNCAPQDVNPALASSLQRTRAALQVELCVMTLLRLLDEHRALSPQFRVKLSIARTETPTHPTPFSPSPCVVSDWRCRRACPSRSRCFGSSSSEHQLQPAPLSLRLLPPSLQPVPRLRFFRSPLPFPALWCRPVLTTVCKQHPPPPLYLPCPLLRNKVLTRL